MSDARQSRLGWIVVPFLLIAGAAAWRFRDGLDDGGPNTSAVISSQREAINAILAAVPARFKVDDEGRVMQLVARGPAMTDAVAVHIQQLPDLKDLQVEGSAIGEAGLEAIGQLSGLESLRLGQTKVTGADLHHLAGLTGLRELFLPECSIGDDGLPAIGQLTGLRLLDLSQTLVTDDGLAALNNLTHLEKLYLAGTEVTGTGFSDLPDPHGLTLLNLSDTPVTSEGLEPLRRFTSMQMLYMDGVEFDDAKLSQLMDIVTESYPHLNGLFLSETPLGDSAVEPLFALAEVPELSLVGLNGTRISKAAFRELAAKTPETRYLVDYDAGGD